MPPLEAWEKVYLSDTEYMASVHNWQGCIACHGGVDGEDDMDKAHEGLISNPSSEPERVCAGCHKYEVEAASTGLHQNLTGYKTTLEARGADFSNPHMQEGFDNHCYTCHASCGECHISRPSSNGSGLIAGHEIKDRASMGDTCTACHGARVANEYKGLNEGVPGSVHWLEEGMPCYECHQVGQYHGDGTEYADRYDGAASPSCKDCHVEETSSESEVVEHNLHMDKVACNVCHVSGEYKNCYNCHVALDDEGLAYYTTDESKMMFKIGMNPDQSEDRPWDYVLVRHVPVQPDTFAFYGDGLLPDFDKLSTWKVATPHNIQRITPQNQSCDNCHDNTDLYLTADDVEPDELAANAGVIVERIPPKAHTSLIEHVAPDSCTEFTGFDAPLACTGCHPDAVEGDWALLSENIHPLNYLVEPAGDVILCEDCHSPDGNFDWKAAGFTDEEIAKNIWSAYPQIEPESPQAPELGGIGVLGIGVILTVIVVVPIARRRNSH
ncbi:MAG: hypothetical protein JXA42_20425 [Anaerolineales bacterium]|nr:hypothetical protein [Anaerolineales bacterium]